MTPPVKTKKCATGVSDLVAAEMSFYAMRSVVTKRKREREYPEGSGRGTLSR
jgi:hypothetical protein